MDAPRATGQDGRPGIWTLGAGMTLGVYGDYPYGFYYTTPTSPTVRNCRFVNCVARGVHGGTGGSGTDAMGWGGNGGPGGAAQGGGAYCGPYSAPLFENCTFTGCTARGGDGGNGGDGSITPFSPPGHGGAWGNKNAPWWWEYPVLDYWKYSGYGGAVYCDEGSAAEFINCNFSDNTAIGGSCGISGANPSITGWPYTHYKIQSFGGAVYASTNSIPTFTNCSFTNNTADINGWPTSIRVGGPTVAAYPTISYGGAVAFETGASPLFTSCNFGDNLATVGGAIYCDESFPLINDSSFLDNTALHGGGVLISQGVASINRCSFTGNEGTLFAAQGGAISALGANAEFNDCNIFNNRSAGNGGGIYVSSRNVGGNEVEGNNSILVKNCLITDNAADLSGGGVAAVWLSDPNIVNCTIVNNTAGNRGAGLSSSYGSFINVVNSIIWDNVSGIGSNGSQIAVSVAPSAMLVHNSDVQGATDPNEFGRTIESLDLVFCIDTTGSMFDDINAVKSAARQITDAIGQQFSDYRIALVDYRDFYDDLNTAAPYGSLGDYPYRDDVDFTANASEIIAGLQPLTAGGGADAPESVYAALMHCIDANALEARLTANGGTRFIDVNSPGVGDWRKGRNVLRVIMLMADAPPHDPEPYTDYVLNDIVTAAGGINPVYVLPVLIGGDPTTTSALTSIATATGGAVVQAADANEVVNAVLRAVGLMKQIPSPIFVDANCEINWDPCTLLWDPGSGNINADPLFISGYLLSQVAAGQPVTSPCVDAGSADVNNPGIKLAGYTTRTDSVPDAGIVDMGYHYPLFAPPQYQLDFTAVVGNGLGQDDIEPDSALFNWWTTVELRVNREPNGFQVLWTGTDNDDSTALTNTVLMDRDRTVTVAFVSNTCNLMAEVIGGHGTVTPTSGTYSRNEVVTLTATPEAGYRVKQWTGTDDDDSYAMTNTVKMAGDKHVTVEFEVPQMLFVPSDDYTTIGAAIEAARPGDIVSVTSGVYHGRAITINKPITITGTNPDDPCVVASTIIDSSGFADRAIIFGAGATENTVLDGFTITSGSWVRIDAENATQPGQNGPDGYPAVGGAMWIASFASPTIKNCVIRNTTIIGGNAGSAGNANDTVPGGRGGWGGWARGGGVYVSPFANPQFINCTIRDCNVTGGNAGNGGNSSGDIADGSFRDAGVGGLWSNDQTHPWWEMRNSDGQPYIGDYRFYSGYGGGVFCDANSAASFIACNIINNSAQGGMSGIGGNVPWTRPEPVTAYRVPSYAGGIYCAENSRVEFIDCNIKGNIAPKPDAIYHRDPYMGHGGGIAFENTAFIRFTGCNISDNIAAVGGGMFWAGGAPEIEECNISANIAYIGGGAYGKEGAPAIIDCNIHNNFAGISPGDVDAIVGQGGGFFGSSMDASILDSRVFDNSADASGGGIYFHGPITNGDNQANITNCLMTGNNAGRDGGAVSANWNVSVKISNCTIHSNNATGEFGDPNGRTGLGGGLYCSYGALTDVINSIIWKNDANLGSEIAVDTGFEHDPRCGTVNVYYSDVRGGIAGAQVGQSCTLNWDANAGNIAMDPKFASTVTGNYCLQQVLAGQPPANQSPCVDAGNVDASIAGLGLYTTRTDDLPDRGTVDMGYHYKVLEPCRFVDIGNSIMGGDRTRWMKDGIIDWTDFIVLADAWLNEGCDAGNDWCKGADLTFNSSVGFDDLTLISECWMAVDTIPPEPNPSQWAIEPYGIWPDKVKMRAVDATDTLWGLRFDSRNPVQYYFECTSGNCHDSGWQYDGNYIDTGLERYTAYSYRVHVRDLRGNTTQWSPMRWTTIEPDNRPPTPDPMTWEIEPNALNATTIAMLATTASDDTNAIQYEFEVNDPNGNVTTSGWRDSPDYQVSVPDPAGPYCFRVRAKDVFDNNTAWSEPVCVSNLGDASPPDPPPTIIVLQTQGSMSVAEYGWSGQFLTDNNRWWHRIVADVSLVREVGSTGPIGIRFICDDSALSSTKKVAVPIIIGQPPVENILGGHTTSDTFQVFFNGSTIVYDVVVGGGGLSPRHVWRVCAYDPTNNEACSEPVVIKMYYIGPPADEP